MPAGLQGFRKFLLLILVVRSAGFASANSFAEILHDGPGSVHRTVYLGHSTDFADIFSHVKHGSG